MVKVNLIKDQSGVIIRVQRGTLNSPNNIDVAQLTLSKIIPGCTRIDTDGNISYKVNMTIDSDGYIDAWETNVNGSQWMSVELLDQIVVRASKIINNHVIVDQDKIDEFSKPVPTTEQQNVADLTLQVYQLQQQIAALGEK
jgi:hypothetical protein